MREKNFLVITGIIFLLIAILHVLRIAYQWEAVIGGTSIPLWVSWFALIASGVLSYFSFTFGAKKH